MQNRVFTIGTELMKNVEEDVITDGPFYTFVGFNVSIPWQWIQHSTYVAFLSLAEIILHLATAPKLLLGCGAFS